MSSNFLITGITSELGLAFRKVLSENNDCTIVATSRSEESSVESRNIKYLPSIDLTQPSDLKKLKNEVESIFSEKFHVINCVGHFPGYVDFIDLPPDEARRTMESNFLTVCNVAHSLLPLMISHGGGHFITFCSHTGYQNYPLMSVFTAAKAAVGSIAKSIANEYSKNNIISNCFALATLLTDSERAAKPHGDFANWLVPEDVAKIVIEFVLKNNKFLNGNILHLFQHSDSFFNESYFGRVSK